jgi:hypothetical protein
MPVTTTMFCLPDEVQTHMNVGNNWTSDDQQITSHIITATALIRAYTRRSWELGNYTQFFSSQDLDIGINRGGNFASFSLNEKPLVGITAVKYNTGGGFADTVAMEEGTDYEVDTDANAFIMYPSVMRAHGRSIKVTYEAGYPVNVDEPALLDVSSQLQQACAIQSAFTFTRTLNQTSGKSQKQDGKGFANFSVSSNGLVMEAQALLRGTARVLVGSYG